jgi:hypothetical protein
MKYTEEKKKLESLGLENRLQKISKDETKKILNNYPTVPLDYLLFLNEIGAGSIKDSTFNLYSNLINFSDLGLENIYELPSNIMLFGDNFSGDFSGFDLTKKDSVIEFWHDDNHIFYTGKTFDEYIKTIIYS